MSTFRPLYDRVLIKRDDAKNETKSGIYTGTKKDKPEKGTVVAVGSGKILEDGSVRPMSVKPGDRIVVSKGTGIDTKIDGETYLIVFEQDIVGVLT